MQENRQNLSHVLYDAFDIFCFCFVLFCFVFVFVFMLSDITVEAFRVSYSV